MSLQFLSMLRSLVENETVFQGETRKNGWRSRLADKGFDPHLGSGLVKIGLDGIPAALIWAFVDDFQNSRSHQSKNYRRLERFHGSGSPYRIDLSGG